MKNQRKEIIILLPIIGVLLTLAFSPTYCQTPILSHNPNPVDLGFVQLGKSHTYSVVLSNIGSSIAKIKDVKVSGDTEELVVVENHSYPVEIVDSNWAFANNGVDSLIIELVFTPQFMGEFNAQIEVFWGLYEDKTYTIPVLGVVQSCTEATEAIAGENWAAGPNKWFTYTADKFQLVSISTCHPENPNLDGNPLTTLVYKDCQGNLMFDEPDLPWDSCGHNKLSLTSVFPMDVGETVKLYFAGPANHDSLKNGFYFNIIPEYPLEGDICETPTPITLPVVNHFGTTVGFNDDYHYSPCTTQSNYMLGNDYVYTIELENEGYLNASILGTYVALHILDECPKEALDSRHCKGYIKGYSGGEIQKRINPGTYYAIVSTAAPPQATQYLLNMSFSGLSSHPEENDSELHMYPNPADQCINLSFTNPTVREATVEIINISGQIVLEKQLQSHTTHVEIDVSKLKNGIYYLRYQNLDEVLIKKILVQ